MSIKPRRIAIALYERAVGFYASLVNINAYHQPGVEAGKKAAASVLALQQKVRAALSATPQTAEKIAANLSEDPEAVFHAPPTSPPRPPPAPHPRRTPSPQAESGGLFATAP